MVTRQAVMKTGVEMWLMSSHYYVVHCTHVHSQQNETAGLLL